MKYQCVLKKSLNKKYQKKMRKKILLKKKFKEEQETFLVKKIDIIEEKLKISKSKIFFIN